MRKLSGSFGGQGAQRGEELEYLGIATVLENIKRNDDGLRRLFIEMCCLLRKHSLPLAFPVRRPAVLATECVSCLGRPECQMTQSNPNKGCIHVMLVCLLTL